MVFLYGNAVYSSYADELIPKTKLLWVLAKTTHACAGLGNYPWQRAFSKNRAIRCVLFWVTWLLHLDLCAKMARNLKSDILTPSWSTQTEAHTKCVMIERAGEIWVDSRIPEVTYPCHAQYTQTPEKSGRRYVRGYRLSAHMGRMGKHKK